MPGYLSHRRLRRVRISDVLAMWSRDEGEHVCRQWQRTRLGQLRRAQECLGDVRLDKIGREDLWKLRRYCEAEALSPSTTNKLTHHTLAAACRDAGLERKELFRSVRRLPVPKCTNRGAWTVTERDLILETAREMLPRVYYAYIAWLFMTGMRCGEALRLTWDMVDVKRRWCSVPGTKTAAAARQIRIPRAAAAVLAGLNRKHQHVFTTDAGAVVNHNNFNKRRWKPLMDALEGRVPRRAVYCTRHTYVTNLIESGMKIETVARYIGDSPKQVHETYLRWTLPLDDDLDEALDLDRAIR